MIVSRAMLKLEPKLGETSIGREIVGIIVFVIKANREKAKISMGRNSQLRLKNSLLAMPKIKIKEDSIKTISQAVWKLTAKSKNREIMTNSQTKTLTNLFLEIKIRLAAKGSKAARKTARAFAEPMVLNEVDLAKSKGKRNLPRIWGKAIKETNNPETARIKTKPKTSSGLLKRLTIRK